MRRFLDDVDEQCWHMVKCVIKNTAKLTGEDASYLFDMMSFGCAMERDILAKKHFSEVICK